MLASDNLEKMIFLASEVLVVYFLNHIVTDSRKSDQNSYCLGELELLKEVVTAKSSIKQDQRLKCITSY